uniref:Laminin G domain-containing protein n=1 Tax=Chaetoceros debilis TaxID=122233 RepID=A0A7S3QJ37_9STRA|mmetsp:Transcript_5937/g.8433  ORF Transcript_5937/g.8433 Transcript_5937/m.8433 type:complete len:715 (+) Transcript_5937:130-2274(+)
MMKLHIFPIAAVLLSYAACTIHAQDWGFLVMTDWHRGEVFATTPDRDSEDYKVRLDTLSHIKRTYGGELVVMPGDVATGKWHRPDYINKYFPGMTNAEAVLKAGNNCFGTIRSLFTDAGYEKVLVAVGDHELGDNYWISGDHKTKSLPQFREAFSNAFNSNQAGSFKYEEMIGSVNARPIGTIYESTSFAHQHKNVLFVTVDVFMKLSQDADFFDATTSEGGEGVVTGSVAGDHLQWFEQVLQEGNKKSSIDHIIVQAHLPILLPTRKSSSSAMSVDGGVESEFWQLMVQYGVSVYLGGEVHTVTATKDPSTNLVQVISRSNFNNGFLKVKVKSSGLEIVAYGEEGPNGRDNRTYSELGQLSLPRDVFDAPTGSGSLKLVDINEPLIYYSFDESMPLIDRPVDGMGTKKVLAPDMIEINGEVAMDSVPNYGEFGQQYDAQIANVELSKGVMGNAAMFSPDSRMSVYSMGPFSGGTAMSYSFWFKTKGPGEMILFHYAPKWALNEGGNKNVFSLTLNDGQPKLYASPTSVLTGQSWDLNDGRWHNIAVIMPRASCRLSEVKMYVDNEQVETESSNDNPNLYLSGSGYIGIGGYGYTEAIAFSISQGIPFEGKIDELYVWGRTVLIAEVARVQKKEFQINETHKCVANEKRFNFETTELEKDWHCARSCRETLSCLGYEIKLKASGKYRCLQFKNRHPRVGKEVTLGNKPNCVVLV